MGTSIFGQIRAFDSLTELGLVFVSLFSLIDGLREVVKLLMRQSTNFLAVLFRAVIAAVTIVCIPWLATTLAELVLAIANALLKEAVIDGFISSFEMAITGGGACPDADWTDYITALFNPSAWLWILAPFLTVGAMLLKLIIVDVAWPVFFALEVYFGLLSIPLTYLQGDGGVKSYAQRVLSVAVWPIVYAFILVLMAAMFRQTISDASRYNVLQRRCEATVQTASIDESHSLASIGQTGVGGSQGFVSEAMSYVWLNLRFQAVIFVFILLTWKVPQFSGRLMGVQEAPGILGAARGVGAAGKALKKGDSE